MTSHIDYSCFVLSGQRQETSGEVHGSEEIHIDLIFDNCIGLPLKLTKTHHSGVIH